MLPIRIESFEGPLDLLLKLIEQEQLDITEVSLALVTNQYLAAVRQYSGERRGDELADFLVVAAKLVLIKSRSLLPSLTTEEDSEIEDLTQQLRIYQEFLRGAKILEKQLKNPAQLFARPFVPVKRERVFAPPPSTDASALAHAFRAVVAAITLPMRVPTRIVFEARVTLHERIRQLHELVRHKSRILFHHALASDANRADIVVSFLALLELIKQRVVDADQGDLFSDIAIRQRSSTETHSAQEMIGVV